MSEFAAEPDQADLRSISNFRPPGHLYFALMGRAFGMDFPPYITPIFAIHLLNALLLFLLMRKLGIDVLARTGGRRVLRAERHRDGCVLEAHVRLRSALHHVQPREHPALRVPPLGPELHRVLVRLQIEGTGGDAAGRSARVRILAGRAALRAADSVLRRVAVVRPAGAAAESEQRQRIYVPLHPGRSAGEPFPSTRSVLLCSRSAAWPARCWRWSATGASGSAWPRRSASSSPCCSCRAACSKPTPTCRWRARRSRSRRRCLARVGSALHLWPGSRSRSGCPGTSGNCTGNSAPNSRATTRRMCSWTAWSSGPRKHPDVHTLVYHSRARELPRLGHHRRLEHRCTAPSGCRLFYTTRPDAAKALAKEPCGLRHVGSGATEAVIQIHSPG